jgi:magnesium-transporting ATPase (P-type)
MRCGGSARPRATDRRRRRRRVRHERGERIPHPRAERVCLVESLLTELAVLLVLRPRRPVYSSKPGRGLAIASALVAMLALALPFLPHAELLGFVRLPWPVLAAMLAITAAYVAVSEGVKRALLSAAHGTRAAFGNY